MTEAELRAKLDLAEQIVDAAALIVEGYRRQSATDAMGDLADLVADWQSKY